MKNFTLLLIICFLSVISFGQEATFNWVQDTISENNTLQGMTVTGDSSAIIIGYDNTFKKTSDYGQTWNNIDAFKAEYDFIGLSSSANATLLSSRKALIINHPAGGVPDVYVSGIILKSLDMGNTWSVLDVSKIGTGDDPTINPNANGGYAKDIFAVGLYNADTLLAYSGWNDISTGEKESHGAVFRTNDAGYSWEAITPDFGSKIITSIKVKDSIAVIGGNNKLYVTNLLTDSVIDLYPNLALETDSNIYVNAITVKSVNEFYITTTSDGIFKTENGGDSFTKFDGIGGSNDICIINDSTIIALGSSTKSMVSTDNGSTWTNCYPGKVCYSIGGILGDTLYGMGKTYAYKIAVSDLVSKTFKWSTTELNKEGENLQKMIIYDNNNAVIIGYAEMCKKTTDGGLTWNQVTLPEEFNEDVIFDFNSISNNEMNAYSTVRRFKIADLSADSAITDFYMEGLIISTTDNWKNISILDVSKIGANDGDDVTLNPQTNGCFGLNPFTIECVDANNAYLYANWYETVSDGTSKTRGRVFKTTNGGDSWTGITQDLGSAYINGIQFINETGYIGGKNVLLKTIDGGTTLTDLYPAMYAINPEDSTININSITLIDENEFYVSTTSNGVFYTTNGGDSFSKFEGVAGTSDFYKLDRNSFMLLGTTSKSYFTNDGGANWQNPDIGKTIYSIGEVFNDSLYALGKGIVYKIAISDLDLRTSTREIVNNNKIKVQYHTDYINVVSSERIIDRCMVYSIAGKLVSINEPNSNICRLNRYEFKPGIYIITASVKGERFTKKIVFK